MLHLYDFGAIRGLRKKKQMTIAQLAERSNLTFPTLASIETNKTVPALGSLHQIAKALDISLTSLLFLCRNTVVFKSTAQAIQPPDGSDRSESQEVLVALHGDIQIHRISGQEGTTTNSQWPHADVFELNYVLSGEIEVTVNNRKLQAGKDETLFFDGLVHHTHTFLSASEILIVHIPKNNFSLHSLFA